MRLVQVQAPLALAIVTNLITALLAQQAPSPANTPPVVLKATTHLVQVSVIAQDGKGQPINDLKKEDFRIRVNGTEQTVKVFSVDSNLPLPSSDPQKSAQLAPNVFSNRTDVAPGQKSSITIILIDALNTRWADQQYAKAQAIRYLRTLHPGDHIGVYLLGKFSLRVLQDYTADAAELLSRMQALQYKALPNMSSREPHAETFHNDSLMFDDLLSSIGRRGRAERAFYAQYRINDTFKALQIIADHLAQTPGRKNLIWVSGGFPLFLRHNSLASDLIPEALTDTVRALNDANIAIYPVDARGLVGNPRYDASERGRPSTGALARPVAVANMDSMFELAGRSGGRAYVNTNDLAKAMHDAIADSRVTYTLGFYPLDENFDGKFHKIDVDLAARKGVHLRYRKGYYDLPALPQDEKTRNKELGEAAWSPLDATGIGLTAKVVPSKTNPGALDIALAIDTSQLNLEEQSQNWLGRLDVLLVQSDEDGNQYNGSDETINLRLNSAGYAKFLKESFVYTKQVNRSDRAQHLRIIVRDAATGAIGSITVPLAKIS